MPKITRHGGATVAGVSPAKPTKRSKGTTIPVGLPDGAATAEFGREVVKLLKKAQSDWVPTAAPPTPAGEPAAEPAPGDTNSAPIDGPAEKPKPASARKTTGRKTSGRG